MSFLAGRVSFERFKMGGRKVTMFDPSHLQAVADHAIGKHGALSADGIEIGYVAGEHVLDVDFKLDKNIINDCLHVGMRVDTNKVPSDLFKAYMQMELSVLAANNPSGFPTKKQRQEAKQTAEERCAEEGSSGKFRRMQQVPMLWDARQSLLYFGSGSQTMMDRFMQLAKESLGRTLERKTAGTIALEIAQKSGHQRALEDLSPTSFVEADAKLSVAWVANEYGSKDFVGNEFLAWLWWHLDTQGDDVKLEDDTSVTIMMNKTLSMECPFAETGKETISSEAPTRLPEARRAFQSGKLPRKTGLILVRHDEQYELTLQAESLAVGGASLPKIETDDRRAELDDRMDQIRHLTETIDLLFSAFLQRRLTSRWKTDAKEIREWLHKLK